MSSETKTQWTPGPWWFARSWYERTGEMLVFTCAPKNGNLFQPGEPAELLYRESSIQSWVSRRTGTDEKTDQHLANAHLIAAAPELYEALDALVKELDDPSRNMKRMQSRYDTAVTALAKARGESA